MLRLLGRDVDVDFDAGIFVTLNPAGKDYGGRSQIPDNLKALFRPVAMGRPDNELIAQVYLQAEGFTRARDLAVKVVSLFALSRQLLTPQRHYDWGLRALKAVLNTGGKLVLDARGAGGGLPPAAEGELLIKAVRVNTLSKLTFGDTARFLALIGDVFPGVASGDVAGGALEVAIRDVMASDAFRLTVDEAQVRKMLQLKEALDQRMGCVVVGPSGCGKSTVWRARAGAATDRRARAPRPDVARAARRRVPGRARAPRRARDGGRPERRRRRSDARAPTPGRTAGSRAGAPGRAREMRHDGEDARRDPRGRRPFRPTSTEARSTASARVPALHAESSTRGSDSPGNRPNRRRSDRDGAFRSSADARAGGRRPRRS